MRERLQSTMIAHGAAIFLVGLLAGFPFTFVLLGKIAVWPIPGAIAATPPGDARGWHMAHMEGILNGLMLIGVAAVSGRLMLSERAWRFVAWALVVAAWANQIASTMGPLLGGRGLEFGGGVTNSLMYLLFVVGIFAVLPAIFMVCVGAVRAARS